MKLLESIKHLFKGSSYSQKYARQNGYNLTQLNNHEWGLSRSNNITIHKFPDEFAACRYIYDVNMKALGKRFN